MSTFRAPARYVQSDGALAAAGEHFARVDGSTALVAGGETALSVAGDGVLTGLADASIDHAGTVRGFEESTRARIDDVADRIRREDADLVVGVGGSTAIDAAKAAAIETDREFVAVPTLASADGPAGGLAVVYDDAGRPVDLVAGEHNPALVLVDTGLVADAPARFLRWGLGDTISTRFEAESCAASGAKTPHGDELSATGGALAAQTYQTIQDHGEDALAAVAEGQVTPAVEAIVENVHLTSVLAWENGGLAGAHALETGLRASGITEPPHGILVGLCTLAQLEWHDHEDCDTVAGLLADLGFEDPIPSGADLEAGAAVACELGLMANEPVDVTPAMAVESIEEARERLAARQ